MCKGRWMLLVIAILLLAFSAISCRQGDARPDTPALTAPPATTIAEAQPQIPQRPAESLAPESRRDSEPKTANVINKEVWDRMPADLQQIMIEEGAKAELEALRLAPFQNLIAVEINKQLGLQPIPFSDEVSDHIRTVVLPDHVIPGWVRRLNYPESGSEIVGIYNAKVAPYSGLSIAADGSVEQVPVSKGPGSQ